VAGGGVSFGDRSLFRPRAFTGRRFVSKTLSSFSLLGLQLAPAPVPNLIGGLLIGDRLIWRRRMLRSG
jgi:hypothetical protein